MGGKDEEEEAAEADAARAEARGEPPVTGGGADQLLQLRLLQWATIFCGDW